MTYFKCLTWIQYLQVLFIFLSIQVSEYHCLDSDLTHSNVFNGIAEVYLQISWKISKENELQRPRHRECIIVLHKFLGCDIKLLLWGVCLLFFFFFLFLTYWQPVAGWFFFSIYNRSSYLYNWTMSGFFSEYWHVLASQQLLMINYNWFPTIIFRYLKLVFKGTQNQYFLKF